MLRTIAAVFIIACAAQNAQAKCQSDNRASIGIVTASNFSCRPGIEPRLADGLAIQGFHLEFLNGDHKPQTLGIISTTGAGLTSLLSDRSSSVFVGTGSNRIRGVLADPDGRDPVRLRLRGLPFRGLVTGTVARADCSGDCVLPVPVTRPPGTTLVLRGFLFARAARFDDNIRRVRIMPRCNDIAQCAYHVAYADNDTRETYRIRIDFVFVPDHGLTPIPFGSLSNRGSSATLTPQGDPTGASDDQLLVGFGLRFDDNDHHLREIAVMPDGDRLVSVRFADNGSPPITGTALFARVSPRELLLR